ncbi:MAG: hypothetical protein HKN36_05875 [Hellea sp.]|nr:hypothetical protein [Hellea sp.]
MSDRENQIAFLRKMQIIGPAAMILIAALIYLLWDNEQKSLVVGIVAFLSIPDFLTFKFLADRLES